MTSVPQNKTEFLCLDLISIFSSSWTFSIESLICGIDSPVKIDSFTTQFPLINNKSHGKVLWLLMFIASVLKNLSGSLWENGISLLRNYSSVSLVSPSTGLILLAGYIITMSPGNRSSEFILSHLEFL